MGTVTIAATYGAGGSVVAPRLAERLGLPMIDRAIPADLAGRAAAEDLDLAADEVDDGGILGQLFGSPAALAGLAVGAAVSADTTDLDGEVARTEAALRLAADRGGTVILGRAAVFVLARRRDVLHVRLGGPEPARLRQGMRLDGIDEATAAQRLRDTDRARAAYVRRFHPGRRWDDPCNYHLVIDSTAVGLDACVDVISRAAADRFSHQEPPSR